MVTINNNNVLEETTRSKLNLLRNKRWRVKFCCPESLPWIDHSNFRVSGPLKDRNQNLMVWVMELTGFKFIFYWIFPDIRQLVRCTATDCFCCRQVFNNSDWGVSRDHCKQLWTLSRGNHSYHDVIMTSM